ncbi:SNX4 [Mytilus edulis]|uniref:SNX4 n=1 Tax=Mytilus edulis TaxID=6550 RepID=A0A8S3UBZ6_MYTED|nr:SNX4 [Mytilus edulis]
MAALYVHITCNTNHLFEAGQTVEGILEEEEQYADQLKEYMAFADSLSTVCRKYECMQYDFERAEDNLTNKQIQKEQLNLGKAGNTPEQREQKIKQLEEQIKQADSDLRKVGEETQKFIDTALRDIDRFKRQKVKDLREIFTNYAIMQIKQCKKGIAVWTSAKDCLTKM